MGSFRKIGEWERVAKMVAAIGPNMKKAQELSLRRWGLKAEGTAKKHVSAQDLGWVPLKPATISKKVAAGFSENILVETSTYFQAITSWVDGDMVHAGVRRGVRTKDGEVELGKVAATHEYGSEDGRIPARPLWKPTFDETMIWHQQKNTPLMHFAQLMARY